jgi:hypothetical protein
MITACVSDLLWERLIKATYNNEKSKVTCLTTEGVDFQIWLYWWHNQYSHGIIVEVQRWFGSSLHFYSNTNAILDAAKAMPLSPSMTALTDHEDDDEDIPLPSGSSSLMMVSKMFSLPGFDAQYLGLQTLSSLVDSERMSLSTV